MAETLLVAVLSKTIDLAFARVQFTIDLMPSDIIGSEILDQRTHEFRTNKGPIFTNLLLADEINRAAPKVQSALLEAMQERKVTIGKETFKLPAPFLVIATQNPVEQSGTFELPEAQLVYYALEPGNFDLRDYLRRKDGSSAASLPSLPVTIRPLLPPGQIEPHPLEIGKTPWPAKSSRQGQAHPGSEGHGFGSYPGARPDCKPGYPRLRC